MAPTLIWRLEDTTKSGEETRHPRWTVGDKGSNDRRINVQHSDMVLLMFCTNPSKSWTMKHFKKMHDGSRYVGDFLGLTSTWEALMSLGVYNHRHIAILILTVRPLWLVTLVQRAVVVISVIPKQTLNKSSLQLYPNLYSVYKKYPGLETFLFWDKQ